MSASEIGLRTWWIREPGKPAIYRIAAGGLITAVGSEMTAIAFGFFLYDRTGSAFWLCFSSQLQPPGPLNQRVNR